MKKIILFVFLTFGSLTLSSMGLVSNTTHITSNVNKNSNKALVINAKIQIKNTEETKENVELNETHSGFLTNLLGICLNFISEAILNLLNL